LAVRTWWIAEQKLDGAVLFWLCDIHISDIILKADQIEIISVG